MRKLIILAVPFTLAACAQEAAVEEAVTEDVAAVAEEMMTTPNGIALPLVAEVTGEDGPMGVTTVNADGTFMDVSADGETTNEGTYEVVDGKGCFTSGDGEVECWTEGEPAEDGSFTVTSDEGVVQTVMPTAAE